jgi:putative flippase GtrA
MSCSDARTLGESRWLSLRSVFYEAVRFVGMGFISFPLGLGISALCHEVLGWPEEIAVATAIGILLILNFFLSRIYVFRSIKSVRSQLVRFVAVALTMRGAEYLLFLLLLRVIHVPYLVAMATALVISLGIKFVIYRTWVFSSGGAAGER